MTDTEDTAKPEAAQPEVAAELAPAAAGHVPGIGLSLVGGLAIGFVVGAMLPRSSGRKMSKQARAMAAMLAELAPVMAARAGDAASDGRDKLGEIAHAVSDSFQEHAPAVIAEARRLAEGASSRAQDAGTRVARKASKISEKMRG